MTQRSPTIEGFRLMFSRPALGLAEIAWRWSFGAAAILSLTFLFIEYLRTLPVSPGDLFLLRTRHPLLIYHAVAHIFQGSAVRLARSGFLLLLMLSAAWIILASLARTATIRALLNYFSEDCSIGEDSFAVSTSRLHSPFGLNLLRVFATVAALLACLATFVLARAASPAANPSAARATLVFLTLALGISLAWSSLNWILSLAAVFVVADGSSTVRAVYKAVELWRVRWGSIMAAGTWFGIAHAVVFFIATSLVAFPLAFVGVLPSGIVLGGVLLITLLYFATADFLYAGKMAAYVAIATLPEQPKPVSLISASYSAAGIRASAPEVSLSANVDRSESILSDIPAQE